MKNRFVKTSSINLRSRERIRDISILIPKIRSEFFIRLYSFLGCEAEISSEGYEFYIKDNETGKEFSAGLTGFGPGYFASEQSDEMIDVVNKFHNFLFTEFSDLKTCRLEIENDFGKTILGLEDDSIIELDLEE